MSAAENLLLKYPFPSRSRYEEVASWRHRGGKAVDQVSPVQSRSLLAGETVLTHSQKIALLTMRGSDWSKAVLAKVSQLDPAQVSGADYSACANLGLAVHKGAFHVLTGRGRFLADQLAQQFARDAGMHVVTYDHGRPGLNGKAASARCSCGWIAYRSRSIPSWAGLIGRDAYDHLRHVGGNS